MSVFAVTYSYGGPAEVLAEHRPAHRAYLDELAAQGKLLGSGPFSDAGPDGALLVFSARDTDEVEELLAKDPAMIHGAVTEHGVRQWNVTKGPWAAVEG